MVSFQRAFPEAVPGKEEWFLDLARNPTPGELASGWGEGDDIEEDEIFFLHGPIGFWSDWEQEDNLVFDYSSIC